MLDAIDKSAFLKLFIRNGYVLDFNTNDFDIFTTESIGVPLCKQYNLSKGKSLRLIVLPFTELMLRSGENW